MKKEFTPTLSLLVIAALWAIFSDAGNAAAEELKVVENGKCVKENADHGNSPQLWQTAVPQLRQVAEGHLLPTPRSQDTDA